MGRGSWGHMTTNTSSDLIPAGPLQLGNLPNVWAALDEIERRAHAANDRNLAQMDFTDRKFDEASATGRRAYINAHAFISVARDNQKALEAMLLASGVRPYAPWNLIRPSFEAAFYVVWMLEPNEGRERMRRALRIAWEEQRNHGLRLGLKVDIANAKGQPDVLKAEQRHRDIKKSYVDEANAVGMSQKQVSEKPNLTTEIPKLESLKGRTPGEEKFHLLIWRELSGIQHADMGAGLGLSDKTYRLKIPGGYTAVVSINDESFMTACYSSALMQLTAMNLYIQRSTTVTKAR